VLAALDERVREAAGAPLALGALERLDREAGVQDWLDARLPDCDADPASLVDLGFTVDSLEALRRAFGEAILPQVLGRAACWHTIVGVGEISAERRVTAIVNAQVVRISTRVSAVSGCDGLEDTLVVLGGRLGRGRAAGYDRGLPRLMARGHWVVWTNLSRTGVARGARSWRCGRPGGMPRWCGSSTRVGIGGLIDRVFGRS
jgi:hypothetical protein